MSKVKLELNERGIIKLLKSHEMKVGLGDIAQNIAEKAGEGYESDIKYMRTRVIASAYTATEDAMKDNDKNNTLRKAVK